MSFDDLFRKSERDELAKTICLRILGAHCAKLNYFLENLKGLTPLLDVVAGRKPMNEVLIEARGRSSSARRSRKQVTY